MVTYAQCGKKTANDFFRVCKFLITNKLSRTILTVVFGVLMVYIGIAHGSIPFVLIGLLGVGWLVFPVFIRRLVGLGLFAGLLIYLFL